MTERRRIPTGAPWAATVGYSRAVRVGNVVYVSGTAPVGDDGHTVHPGDPYLQARRCLDIIVAALRDAGAAPEHVVRTRMYVTAAGYWEPVGRAHGEVFGHACPATTLVVVAGLIDPDMVVEIEAEAVIPAAP